MNNLNVQLSIMGINKSVFPFPEKFHFTSLVQGTCGGIKLPYEKWNPDTFSLGIYTFLQLLTDLEEFLHYTSNILQSNVH